jgi:hypothetical protein
MACQRLHLQCHSHKLTWLQATLLLYQEAGYYFGHIDTKQMALSMASHAYHQNMPFLTNSLLSSRRPQA